jgi:hypothetical protein
MSGTVTKLEATGSDGLSQGFDKQSILDRGTDGTSSPIVGPTAGGIKIEAPIKGSMFTPEDLAVLANPPPPAENYARAFDPNGDLYSVNTGNANVTQVENLSGIFSAPPAAEKQDNGGGVLAGLGLLWFLL